MPAVALELEESCSPRPRHDRDSAENGGVCAFDGAHASRFSSFLREARRSLQPVLLDRRSLLVCEHHRRRSLRRSAVDAETKIGTA